MIPAQRLNTIVLGGLLAISVSIAGSPSTITANLPSPNGLKACKSDDPMTLRLRASISRFGDFIGCFVSTERIHLGGAPRNADVPLEYAIAIDFAPSLGPYSSSDVQAMFVKVSDQWKNYGSLDRQRHDDYEKRINELIASDRPSSSPAVTLKLQPPTLISIERIGNESYSVISIRQRTVAMNGISLVSTSVEAAGIVLRNHSLIRVEVHRELRTASDIAVVRDGTKDWLTRLAR
jgi:hypothetical protein